MLAALSAICTMFLWSQGNDPQAAFMALVAKQESSREQVVTLTLEGIKFVGGVPHQFNELEKDELRQLVSAVSDLVHERTRAGLPDGLESISPAELALITESMFPDGGGQLRPTTPTGGWRPFKLIEDSGRTKVEDGEMQVVRRDGAEDRYDPRLKQASVFSSHTGLIVETIETFFPSFDRLQALSDWTLSTEQNGELVFRTTNTAVHYDPSLEFVRRISMIDSGKRPYERMQYCPIVISNKVQLPRCVAEIRSFKDGKTASLNIYVVNKVEHNVSVDPTTFSVNVPEGTRIVQFSKGESVSGARVERAVSQVNDVRDHVSRADFGKSHRPGKSNSSGAERKNLVVWILPLNVIAVILLWWVWRVKRPL